MNKIQERSIETWFKISLLIGIKDIYSRNIAEYNSTKKLERIDMWMNNKMVMEYMINNVPHSRTRPSCIYDNGYKEYRLFGKRHRHWQEGPASVGLDWEDCWERRYYFNGKLHRPWQEGPAVVDCLGLESFWYEGKKHRPWQEGPAIYTIDGVYFYEHDKSILPWLEIAN